MCITELKRDACLVEEIFVLNNADAVRRYNSTAI